MEQWSSKDGEAVELSLVYENALAWKTSWLRTNMVSEYSEATH